jgi:streptomycin 6-kinase
MDCEPFETAPIEAFPTLTAWMAESSEIVHRMLDRWELIPGEAFVGGVSGSVIAVTTASGDQAVLKVGYPHEEAIWEAVGLGAFPEGVAPAVLRQDAWTWSLLLTRVSPGIPLSRADLAPAEALRVGGSLRAELGAGTVDARIPTLAAAMRDYSSTAIDRMPAQAGALDSLGVSGLVHSAVELLERLASSDGEHALLHGDFNPGNILLGADGRWSVVDPKPLIGDPCYDLWPLVSQIGAPYEASDPVAALADQLTIAADAAGVDRTRAALWAFARTGLNVSWYLADGMPAQAEREAAALRAWATVARQ